LDTKGILRAFQYLYSSRTQDSISAAYLLLAAFADASRSIDAVRELSTTSPSLVDIVSLANCLYTYIIIYYVYYMIIYVYILYNHIVYTLYGYNSIYAII